MPPAAPDADDPLNDRLRPWPPEGDPSPALSVVAAVFEEGEPLASGDIASRFTEDVVITPPPTLAPGTFRPYFGVAGVRQWLAEIRQHSPGLRVVPERYVASRRHVVVLGRVVTADRDMEAAWLWSVRDGRVSAVRTFRYGAEALLRLEALESGDGDGG